MVRIGSSALVLSFLLALATPCAAAADDMGRWQQTAKRVDITRDDWGIAHIKGPTDADAVFGMIYAQAEDDFNRVETNYLKALGRQAEADGEGAVYQDLRMKLFIDPVDLQARYRTSPSWLKALMNSWADGLNYFLATHPQVKPRVITRFEPWMALAFSEGSIGGDISGVSVPDLQAFYGKTPVAMVDPRVALRFIEPKGSNGIAIAPSNTAGGHALLLINPHTSFFFRSELQMTSAQGLNAYGAVTWGQFFIYQGFNARAGWMHTTSGVDVVDEFAETIVKKDGKLFYRYGSEERPVISQKITVPYRAADGTQASKSFTVYRTHHGPIVREADGKWISVSLMNRPVEALSQSFLRTKAKDYASFIKVAALQANSSNNTLFADSKGEIAFLPPQFIPKRDNRFDYTAPVDGSDPATDWQGLHALSEAPRVVSPANGWVFNTNNWPYSAAGANSPKLADFPRYMDTYGENPRGIHALALLPARKDFSLQGLMEAAYDPAMPAFDVLIPALVSAYDQAPATDPLRAKLAAQIEVLRQWDRRWSATSIPTTLAVLWGENLWEVAAVPAKAAKTSVYDAMIMLTTPQQKLAALAMVSDQLARDFGDWRTPWGEINRFQRLTGDIVHPFNDAGPSLPVPFTSGEWGSLASFGKSDQAGTKKRYGVDGNSFVAVVEFGDRVRARAVTAGGESGDPKSPHFNDQAPRYAAGDLREVYFYPDQRVGHVERQYKPGF